MQTNETQLTGENESMVLEEEIDENYEPTQEEILEYSQYIGLDPEADKDILYLAKEGLKAPLPSDWKPCQNREGKIYYFNFKTKQSQWEHPCDEYYKKLCQEMKRKKTDKPTTNKSNANKTEKTSSKGAFNMPFAKQDSLPAVKTNPTQQQSYNQSLEASFSADNQLFTMNHKMSFSNDNQENNSLTDKKFDGKVLPADFESFQSLGSEKGNINSEELQEDEEEKLNEYKGKGQSEVDKLAKTHREAESKLEKQLKQKMERELQQIKTQLSVDCQQHKISADYIKEKETLKNNMKNEYKKTTEEGILKLEKEYANKKKEVEASEANKLKDNLQVDEEQIKEEFEAKQAELIEEKKKLDVEREKQKAKEQIRKIKVEEQLEIEKKDIVQEYAGLIREIEAEELYLQKQEIEEYKRELQLKMAEERQTLVLARKQKESINLTRKNELNELYARRLKLEQDKQDNEMLKSLKEYEENEKKKKDKEIVKMHNMELAHEKEKIRLTFQEEMDELQASYTERLTNYQKILKDKFKKEKNILDKEVAKLIDEYKRGVDAIKPNVSTREEILGQINKINIGNRDSKKEIAELEQKIEMQQEENKKLKGNIESIKESSREESSRMIEDLRKKVKDAENQINTLTQKIQRRNEMPRQRPKSVQNIAKPLAKSNSALGAIKKDVKDIKAFLTKRESVPRPSRRDGYESGRMSEVSRRFSPARKSMQRYEDYSQSHTYRDWTDLVVEEENRIQIQKQELEVERMNLKKDREVLATDREMHRKEYPPLISIVDSQDNDYYKKEVRKRKSSLNTQIYHLNNDITRLRGDEALLKNKEKSLRYLRDAVEKFENEEIGSNELEAVYHNYQETDMLAKPANEYRSRSSINKENRGSVLSNRKSKKVLPKWRESFNGSPGSPNEESCYETNRTHHERGSVSYRPLGKENMRSGNISREKIYRSRPSFKAGPPETGYSYNSLIDVLHMKVRNETRVNSSVTQNDISDVRETRVQANNFFSQHSQWLKDMKDQLNKHLYERPAKGSMFFMK